MSLDKFVKHLKTRKEQVEYLLEKYPNARNNDFYLLLLWLRHFGDLNIPWIEYRDIRKLSGSLETVRRVRQVIQNVDGHFVPTDEEVLRKRRTKERLMRRGIKMIEED